MRESQASEPTNATKDIGSKSFMVEVIEEYHRMIPRVLLPDWANNLRQTLEVCSIDSELHCQSGCSGTDFWLLCNEALLAYWSENFGVECTGIKSVLAAESDPKKREFLKTHNPPAVLVGDVEHFSMNKVWDYHLDAQSFLPMGMVTAGGISCTSRSKQNKNRSSNVGCVRNKTESTGIGF